MALERAAEAGSSALPLVIAHLEPADHRLAATAGVKRDASRAAFRRSPLDEMAGFGLESVSMQGQAHCL